MGNERKLRLIQVAKEFKVGLNTITDFLQKKGIKSDGSPNTLVDAATYAVLEKEFGANRSAASARDTIRERISLKQTTITLEEAKKQEREEEKEVVIKSNVISVKDEIPQPKFLGKIDLSPKPRTAPAAQPAPQPAAGAQQEPKAAPAHSAAPAPAAQPAPAPQREVVSEPAQAPHPASAAAPETPKAAPMPEAARPAATQAPQASAAPTAPTTPAAEAPEKAAETPQPEAPKDNIFRPATVTYWEFNRPLPFYLKVGAGYPLNSVVDFYATTQNPSTGYVIGYVNHEGSYSKIANEIDAKNNSTRMYNRAGVAAGKYLGRHVLEGELSYDNRMYHRYGSYTTVPDPTEEALQALDAGGMNDYGNAALSLRFGDDFQDLSRVNFEVALHGDLFFDNKPAEGKVWFYRMDMPEGVKHFNKTRPINLKDFEPVIEWWIDRQEIKDEESGTFKAKCFTAQELADLNYDFGQCGFQAAKKKIPSPEDTIMTFIEKRNALNEKLDRQLQDILSLMGVHHDGNL